MRSMRRVLRVGSSTNYTRTGLRLYHAVRDTQRQKIGFDSARIADEGGKSIAVMNPTVVRSRFAAFDPARRHEADLLGQVNPELLPWLMGAGLLGGYGVSKVGTE